MTKLQNKEKFKIPDNIEFPVRRGNNWETVKSGDIFKNKKVVLFSLPGAFTPTCSTTHLPRYEELYDTFKAQGIDEIYCVSVNDTFVMNEWAKAQEIEHIKMLPDGNAKFTKAMGMLVDKENLGFGQRSWRYSALIDNGVVVKHFIEPDKEGDPFEVSDADTMLKFIAPNVELPKAVTIFSKAGCPFCAEAKEILKGQEMAYSEVVLGDGVRQKTLNGITGKNRATSPQVFIDGNLIGGLDDLKNHFQLA